jgi:hypothetical protein
MMTDSSLGIYQSCTQQYFVTVFSEKGTPTSYSSLASEVKDASLDIRCDKCQT